MCSSFFLESLDRASAVLIDPHSVETSLGKLLAWMTTAALMIKALGAIHACCALWRMYRSVAKNHTQAVIFSAFRPIFCGGAAQSKTAHIEPAVLGKELQTARRAPFLSVERAYSTPAPISQDFVNIFSIEEQRTCHNAAKDYLRAQLPKVGGEIDIVSLRVAPLPDRQKTRLNRSVFFWENTSCVGASIQEDGKKSGFLALYGVASQFNGAEAPGRFTVLPNKAVDTYKTDHTQGPVAQLQFPEQQVEILNNSANIGFNGMCYLLNEHTKTAVQHGYFTPICEKQAEEIVNRFYLQQAKDPGQVDIEYICIGNNPEEPHGKKKEKVYQLLTAAPAFGSYSQGYPLSQKVKNSLAAICAYQGFRALFHQAIILQKRYPQKTVVVKPAALGLGVFGNDVSMVADGFQKAAEQYQEKLHAKGIEVRLQVYLGQGLARQMAKALQLKEYPSSFAFS